MTRSSAAPTALPLLFLALFFGLVGVGLCLAPAAPVAANGNDPDLAISKSAEPDPVNGGSTLTYTLTITNTGGADAAGVVVTDTLPVSVTFEAASDICDYEAGFHAAVCTVGDLLLGQATAITVAVTVDPAAANTITNTATVSADQVAPTSLEVETTVNHPGLSIGKRTATPVIRVGEAVAFTITVTNTGDVPLSDVAVVDAVVPDCGQTIGSLGIDASTEYTCSVSNVPADLTNTAVVSGTPPAGGVVTATGRATVDVINPSLAVSKTPDLQLVRSGGTARFTITVTNTGDVPLENVSRFDPLVPECGGMISHLAAGAYVVNYCSSSNVKADLTNRITVTAASPRGPDVISSDTADVDVIGPTVALAKAPASQMVRMGGTALFTITVTNSGDVNLEDVTVVDPRAPGCARTIDTLLKSTASSYTCTVTPVTVSFTNVATVTGTPPDATPITDTAVASVNLINPAIAVAKLPPSQRVRFGDTVTFTIRVTNTGDIALTGVVLSDVVVSDCARSVGTLASLSSTQFTCSRTAVTGGFTNVVTATGKPPVGPNVLAAASANVEVISPAIRIGKLPDLQTVNSGDPVTFTIVVTNSGDSPLTSVMVADPAAPACTRALGPLAQGAVVSYVCSVISVTVDFTNTATVAGTSLPGTVVSHTDSAAVRVVIPPLTQHPVYLPVVVKAEPLTQLFVTTEKTGGVSRLELWRTSDNVRVHFCENLPDNTIGNPCGAFSPGTYRIEARTARCGLLTTQRTWGAGPVTIRVFCR